MENKEKEDALVEVLAYRGKQIPKNYNGIVRSRWLNTYRKENDYMRITHKESYYFAYGNYVEQVLSRPGTWVRLAVLAEDPDVCLGFSVVENDRVLHYVHVPRPYRKQHIATMLVPEGIEWITHMTRIGLRIWARKLPYAKLNPFL